MNALAAELYNVVDAMTSAVSDDQRDGVASALRHANPDLPDDDTSFDSGLLTFVWTPLIERSPFRIPPYSPELRDDLASIGVRDIDQMAALSLSWLMDTLPGTPVEVEVARLRNICRLMRIRGLDRMTAAALHDDATTPLPTPSDVAQASQADIETIVQDHVTSGFPAVLLDGQPWIAWRSEARFLTAPKPSAALDAAPVPWPPERSSAESRFWREQSSEPSRMAADRASALAIAFLYEVQTALFRANQWAVTGDPAAALDAFRTVYQLVGRRAEERGILSSSSDDVHGPAVSTVAELCRLELVDAAEADLDLARHRAGILRTRGTQGKRSFKLADLSSTPAQSVRTALDGHPVHAVGRSGERALAESLGERTKGSFGQPLAGLTIGIVTQNSSARMIDLGSADAEQRSQNQRVFGVQSLRQSEPTVWAQVEAHFTLHDLPSSLSSSLSGTAKDNLDSSVAAAFPDSLTTNMGPFDAFFTLEPKSVAQGQACHLPLTANFATRYRVDLLEPWAAARRDDAWLINHEDLLDISSFGFLLPAILGRLVPVAMARCAARIGATALANALVDFSARVGVDEPTFSRSLVSVWSNPHGLLVEGSSSAVSYVRGSHLIEIYRQKNHAGDVAYQHGDLGTARKWYSEVLSQARAMSGDDAVLASSYPAIRDDILERLAAGDRSVLYRPWDQYAVEQDGDLVPVLGDRVPSRAMRATSATEQVMLSSVTGSEPQAPELWRPYFEQVSPALGGGGPRQAEPVSDSALASIADTQWASLPLTDPRHSWTTVAIDPIEAAILAEVLYASARLDALAAGFNWLGFDPCTVPPWTYSYLLAQARYYCGKADELQQRTFSALVQAEAEEMQQLLAEQGSALSALQALVAQASVDVAAAQVEVAHRSYEAAINQRNYAARDKVFSIIGAAVSVVGSAITFNFGAIGGAITQIASARTQLQVAHNNVSVAFASLKTSHKQLLLAEAEKTVASMRAEHSEAVLRQLIGKEGNAVNLDLLRQVIENIASSYLLAANRLAWLAERAFAHETRRIETFVAQYYTGLAFHQRFSGAALLLSDLDEMEHVRLASADRRPQLVKATISLREMDPTNLVMLRETGKCVLLVTQRSIDERFPGLFLHAIQRVEVEIDGLIPATGVSGVLATPGSSWVRVPNTPSYVDTHALVTHDWLYPRGETSSDAFQLTFNPPLAPPFVMKPVYGKGATQILSEYRRATDSVVLGLPDGALDIFQHHGVDVMWTFTIPRAGNAINFARIVDLRLVLYFTALYDEALATDQQRILAGEEVLTPADPLYEASWIDRGVLLSAATRESDPLPVGLPEQADRVDLRLIEFPIVPETLGSEVKDRVIADYAVSLVQVARQPITLWIRSSAMPKGASATVPYGETAQPLDGQVFTALSDFGFTVELDDGNVEHVPRTGTFPALEALLTGITDPTDADNHENVLGNWTVKILVDDNPDLRLRDDDGDIALTDGGEVAIDADGAMVHDGVDHAHVWIRSRMRIGAGGPVALWTRDDGLGGGVRLVLDATAGVMLTDGTASTTAVDAIHANVWTDVDLQVFGDTAVARLDGVEVARLTLVAATGAGTVAVRAGADASATVSEVRVTRLRYTGLELEDLVDDTFASDATSWTLTNAAWEPASRAHLDLTFLFDVLLFVSYRGRLALPE